MTRYMKYPDLEGGFIYKSIEGYNVVTRDNDFNLLNVKPIDLLSKGLRTHKGEVKEISDNYVILDTPEGEKRASRELFNGVLIKKSIEGDIKARANERFENKSFWKAVRNLMTIKPPKVTDKANAVPEPKLGGQAWNAKGGSKPDHKYIERRPSPTRAGEWIYIYELPNGNRTATDQEGNEVPHEIEQAPEAVKVTNDFKTGDMLKINSRHARVTDSSDNLVAVKYEDGTEEVISNTMLNTEKQKVGEIYHDPQQGGRSFEITSVGDNVFLAKDTNTGELQAFLKKNVFKLTDEQVRPHIKAKLDDNHYSHSREFKEFTRINEMQGYKVAGDDGLTASKTEKLGNSNWTIDRTYNPETKGIDIKINGKADYQVAFDGDNITVLDINATDIVGLDGDGNRVQIDKNEFVNAITKNGYKQQAQEKQTTQQAGQSVFEYIQKNPDATEKEIASATGLQIYEVKRETSDLMIEGKIRSKNGKFSERVKQQSRFNDTRQAKKTDELYTPEQRAENERQKQEAINRNNVLRNSDQYKKSREWLEANGFYVNANNDFVANKKVNSNGLDFEIEAFYNKDEEAWESRVRNGHYKEVQIGDNKFPIADLNDKEVTYYGEGGSVNTVSVDILKEMNGRNIFEPTKKGGNENIALGKQSEIVFATKEKHKCNYAVVELDDIIASHDENTFTPNKGYPQMEGVSSNDRDYQNNTADQNMIQTVENNWDNRTINNSVLSDQHIIITPENIVVSGNNRTMSAKRVINSHPEAYENYKKQLIEDAQFYGLDPEQIKGMKNPFFVKIDSDFPKDENGNYKYTKSELMKYNDAHGKGKTDNENAMAYGDAISNNSQAMGLLSEAMQGKDTLGEILSDKAVDVQKAFRDVLVKNNVIPQGQAKTYFNENGSLTDNGKTLVRSILKGTFLQPDTFDLATQAGMKQFGEAIVDSVGANTINASLDNNWSLRNHVNEAVRLEAKYQGNTDAKLKGKNFDTYVSTINMFAPHDQRTIAMNLLAKKGGDAYAKVLKDYNRVAQVEQTNNMDDIFGENTTPETLLRDTVINGEYMGKPVFTDDEKKLISQFKFEGTQDNIDTAWKEASGEKKTVYDDKYFNQNYGTAKRPNELHPNFEQDGDQFYITNDNELWKKSENAWHLQDTKDNQEAQGVLDTFIRQEMSKNNLSMFGDDEANSSGSTAEPTGAQPETPVSSEPKEQPKVAQESKTENAPASKGFNPHTASIYDIENFTARKLSNGEKKVLYPKIHEAHKQATDDYKKAVEEFEASNTGGVPLEKLMDKDIHLTDKTEYLKGEGAKKVQEIKYFKDRADSLKDQVHLIEKWYPIKADEGEVRIEKDPTRIQQLQDSISEGEGYMRSGKNIHGEKMSWNERNALIQQINKERAKLGKKPYMTPIEL